MIVKTETIITLVLLQLFLCISNALSARGSFVTFNDTGADTQHDNLSWELESDGSVLRSKLQVNFEKPEQTETVEYPLVWEKHVEIDGIAKFRKGYTSEVDSVEEIFDISEISYGSHVVTLNIYDFTGKHYRIEREMYLNSSPVMSIQRNDGEEIFDPELTISFFGERDDTAGFLDVTLDGRPYANVEIPAAFNDEPVRMSTLTGKKIYPGDLSPGRHVLTFTAHSINGGVTVQSINTPDNMVIPSIEIERTADDKLASLTVNFPPSSFIKKGVVDVVFQGSTIYAAQPDQALFTIMREDILAAFEAHNLVPGDTLLTMIVAVRTANQIENWQVISF